MGDIGREEEAGIPLPPVLSLYENVSEVRWRLENAAQLLLAAATIFSRSLSWPLKEPCSSAALHPRSGARGISRRPASPIRSPDASSDHDDAALFFLLHPPRTLPLRSFSPAS